MPPRTLEAMQAAPEAAEVLQDVEQKLRKHFDLEAYAGRLEALLDGQPDVVSRFNSAFPMEGLEQEREFEGLPDTFRPHFYQEHVGDTQGGIRATPTEQLQVAGLKVHDKREDLHEWVRAFKARGALLAVLDTLQRRPGVRTFVAPSTGNHARGVVAAVNLLNGALVESGVVRVNEYGEPLDEAEAAKLFRAEIYCAESIDPLKHNALIEGGAMVRASYKTLEDATAAAKQEAPDDSSTTALIDPFDTDEVIAGQATLALETLLDLAAQGVDLRAEPLTVRVAVGGGGMITGVQTALEFAMRRGLLHTDSQVVPVEATDNDSFNRAILGQEALTCGTLVRTADGIATLQVGARALKMASHFWPEGSRVVDEGYMLRAMLLLTEAHGGRPPEFAGTLSLASLLKDIDDGRPTGGVQVTIACGGNISAQALAQTRERAETHRDPRVAQAAGSGALALAVRRLMSDQASSAEPRPAPVRVAMAGAQVHGGIDLGLRVVSGTTASSNTRSPLQGPPPPAERPEVFMGAFTPRFRQRDNRNAT